MNELAVKQDIVQCKPRFENMLNRFVQFVDVSALSLKSYNSGIRKFLAYLSENGITSPAREDVLNYKKALCEKYAANSVALWMSALRRFFSWCESEGLYSDITRGVKSPKISHEHKRDAFSAEELKTIIAGISHKTLEDKRNFAMFTLITACGLRTCEIVRANVADDEPLFVSCSRRNKGARLTTQTVSQVCKRSMIAAGYNSKRLTAHSLRHSAITIALLQGMSLDDVSAFARHSSIGVTMVYNHAIQRMKSRCESSIASAIFGA